MHLDRHIAYNPSRSYHLAQTRHFLQSWVIKYGRDNLVSREEKNGDVPVARLQEFVPRCVEFG
jgi:hypothetical protein